MPNIGEAAPEFELLNQDGQRVRLSDYRGKKVVIFAFPKADTAGCNAQACTFRDEFPKISANNAVVLGVSADTPEELRRWKQNRKLPYDLLSDRDHTMLTAYGAWGMSMLGLIKVPIINRSYWVIDENGVLIDQQVGVMPKTSVEKAIQALNEAPKPAQA
jgi:thioredoxin-dependent peroxiredoxin